MFMQVISGPVTDRDTFFREGARWYEELRPDAIGYAGGVWGLTPDGTGLAVATFESEEAAEANGARTEQGEWWSLMEKAFTKVSFQDFTLVDQMLGGATDRAGFVQVIRGRVQDEETARKTMNEDADRILEHRSDILGGLIGWMPDGAFTQVMFFTSEEAARSGETTMRDSDLDHDYREMMAAEPEFLDLPEPRYD